MNPFIAMLILFAACVGVAFVICLVIGGRKAHKTGKSTFFWDEVVEDRDKRKRK